MRLTVQVRVQEGYDRLIHLDEKEMFIEENDQRELINCNYKDRFNSLMSFFFLKQEWTQVELDSFEYKITFENNGKQEVYSFDEHLPDNFNIFMGYIEKLVGDSI